MPGGDPAGLAGRETGDPHRQRVLQRGHCRGPEEGTGRVHGIGAVRAVRGAEGHDRAAAAVEATGRGAQLLRGAVEAEELEQTLSLRIRPQAREAQRKEPIQLDLFLPHEEGYEFKVILTNKRVGTKHVAFHEGRGSQEGIFAELKSHCHMDYVPVTTLQGNQVYLLAGMLAHNLGRELQMIAHTPHRKLAAKRSALWAFEQLGTLQRKLIQRAGRLLRPAGKLVLSMNSNVTAERELLHYLDALEAAA